MQVKTCDSDETKNTNLAGTIVNMKHRIYLSRGTLSGREEQLYSCGPVHGMLYSWYLGSSTLRLSERKDVPSAHFLVGTPFCL